MKPDGVVRKGGLIMIGRNILRAAGFAAAVLGFAALAGFGREIDGAGEGQYKVIQWEMKLRIFEGVKEGIAAAPAGMARASCMMFEACPAQRTVP